VHLKSWTVSVATEAGLYKTFNQPPDPEVLVGYLNRHFPQGHYHCVYEAGFSGFWIHDWLRDRAVDVMVINPADVPTRDKERVNKNDRVDSHKLARALRAGELVPIYVPSRKALEDRSLVRSRVTLTHKQTRVKNQIKALLRFYGVPLVHSSRYWTRALLAWLDDLAEGKEAGLLTTSGRDALKVHLDELACLRQLYLKTTRQIRQLARSEHYRDRVANLCSIWGIGPVFAMELLTELVTIERFPTLNHLASYVGLIPSIRSSGEHEPEGNITRRRNSRLRYVLIESAWIAVRKDNQLCADYLRLCQRMPKTQAIIRIARKQLARVRFVLKNNQPIEKQL
jgi:transposase